MLKKKFLYLFVSFIISVVFFYFQRVTGPTYPYKGIINIGNDKLRFKLPRSCTLSLDCKISFWGKIEGYILYKRYRVNENYTKVNFVYDGQRSYANLKLELPKASKIEYRVFIKKEDSWMEATKKPIVLRFKGYVPFYLLIPHIIFMYLFFLLSTYLFLLNNLVWIFDRKVFYLTFFSLLAGGFIFGPLVQRYAFDVYWSGFPYGYDLTDNKTLLILIIWLFPLYSVVKNVSLRRNLNIAYFFTVLIYLIPHSVLGSEYKFR